MRILGYDHLVLRSAIKKPLKLLRRYFRAEVFRYSRVNDEICVCKELIFLRLLPQSTSWRKMILQCLVLLLIAVRNTWRKAESSTKANAKRATHRSKRQLGSFLIRLLGSETGDARVWGLHRLCPNPGVGLGQMGPGQIELWKIPFGPYFAPGADRSLKSC